MLWANNATERLSKVTPSSFQTGQDFHKNVQNDDMVCLAWSQEHHPTAVHYLQTSAPTYMCDYFSTYSLCSMINFHLSPTYKKLNHTIDLQVSTRYHMHCNFRTAMPCVTGLICTWVAEGQHKREMTHSFKEYYSITTVFI